MSGDQLPQPAPGDFMQVGDGPQLSIERLMAQLVDQAGQILSAQHRLQRLLDANRAIVRELSLPAVLRQIAQSARETAGAQYAALGVIGSDGLLEEFIHVGMDDTTVAAIGDLPKGRGLLGALIEHPEPIRLPHITDDSRSSGFPPGHPPMTTFLGVPIRNRDRVFGNLYLTNRRDGNDFTAEDEELISALAATASIAIENARLYEESRQRQEWLRASGEISRNLLLSDDSEIDTLRRIAVSVKRLAAADVVSVVLPLLRGESELEVVTAVGIGQEDLTGLRYPLADSIAWRAMQEGRGLIVQDVDRQSGVFLHLRHAVPVTQVMAVPLIGESGARGPSSPDGSAATPPSLRPIWTWQRPLLVRQRSHSSWPMPGPHSNTSRRSKTATGSPATCMITLSSDSLPSASACRVWQERQTNPRSAPGWRRPSRSWTRPSARSARRSSTSTTRFPTTGCAAASRRSSKSSNRFLGFTSSSRGLGPLDTLVDSSLITDVEAVVREAMTNVARHAQASTLRVTINADTDQLTVDVSDDGVGLGDSARRSGLANLKNRAHSRGGTLTLENQEQGGLRLRWSIPLSM